MNTNKKDIKILRSLAERYSEIANQDIQNQRLDRYYKTISMDEVRPVVLIDEVPWGEIRDDELVNRCENEEYLWLEGRMRRALYQWEHFQADMVISPEFRVMKKINSSNIGIEVHDLQLKGDTGTNIVSHEYIDQLKNEEDLAKVKLPIITYNREATENDVELAEAVFSGLMPVRITGTNFSYNIWDCIAAFRGVDKLLMDLAMRPEFMHKMAIRFKDIAVATAEQYIKQDLLDTNPIILHCTPASAKELPADDFTGKTRLKDVWGRCAAQIFAAVSPEMHDDFDLVYNQEVFGDCGLLYYGCCEPMDKKIDILRKRFKNLRKISITPWADPKIAARDIGSDFVLAGKPNPAFVNSPVFNPAPVEQEMKNYMEACKAHGTTCEFVLKDISTIANNPNNLTQWAATVEKVIDQYC
jgi:hypothetical protein